MSKKGYSRAAKGDGTAFSMPATSATGSAFGAFATESSLSYLTETPDLAALPDGNLIVNFKNLSKKDAKTRVKALEEIETYANSSQGDNHELDESFLAAWVKVYPRLTIDLDRRARLLSHSILGSILGRAGKRAAPSMPLCIGAWKSGCHDGDRSVSKAALDALAHVFPSLEKQQNINKVYQLQILEFCRQAILLESRSTLSDERVTTAEDAETKHARLLSSALGALRGLVESTTAYERDKHNALYRELLSSASLGNLAGADDPLVRRMLFRLLQIALRQNDTASNIDTDELFSTLLSRRNVQKQLGSSLEHIQVLLFLANKGAWTNISNQSPASSQFVSFVKAQPKMVPASYWDFVTALWKSTPKTPFTLDDATTFIQAVKSAIIDGSNTRSDVTERWGCYVAIADAVLTGLGQADQNAALETWASHTISSIVFLQEKTMNASHKVSSSVITYITTLLVHRLYWDRIVSHLADQLAERIRTSSTQDSSDFAALQDALAVQGVLFFDTYTTLDTSKEFVNASNSVEELVSASIDILSKGLGEPYGVAAVLETFLRRSQPKLFTDKLISILHQFVTVQIPHLYNSRSKRHFATILFLSPEASATQGLQALLSTLIDSANTSSVGSELHLLFDNSSATPFAKVAQEYEPFQNFVAARIDLATTNNLVWSEIMDLMSISSPILSDANTDIVLTRVLEDLNLGSQTIHALTLVEKLANVKSPIIYNHERTSALFQALLLLEQSSDASVTQRASKLRTQLGQTREIGNGVGLDATRHLLHSQLGRIDDDTLSVEILINIAVQDVDSSSISAQLLPNLEAWETSLESLLKEQPPPILFVTDPLGSFIDLVSSTKPQPAPQRQDAEGFSLAIRMSMFTASLLERPEVLKSLEEEHLAKIYRLLHLTTGLANDNLTIMGSNSSWGLLENATVISDHVSVCRRLTHLWLSKEPESIFSFACETHTGFVATALHQMYYASVGRSPPAFHYARAFGSQVEELISAHGWHPRNFDLEAEFKKIRNDTGNLQFAAFCQGFRQPLGSVSSYSRFCNELIAKLTASTESSSYNEQLTSLAALNFSLQPHDQIFIAIAKQRLVFFCKRIISWLGESSLQMEIFRSLDYVLPEMQEVYGDHWQQILASIQTVLREASELSGESFLDRLPLLYASLKLLKSLAHLNKGPDTNEDLQESWAEHASNMSDALFACAIPLGALDDAQNSVAQIVANLLKRLLESLPPPAAKIEELYPLVAAESQVVSQIAFEMLHKQIPAQQELVSTDVALEKTTARLPDELLSLILEAPAPEDTDFDEDNEIPGDLRGYLTAWLLIFDHFINASDKVSADYVEHIKATDSLNPLLEYTFVLLGHSRGKPIDASKFDIQYYGFGLQQSPKQNLQWLLIHLYYLSLLRLPTLVKTWWMYCKSRQTVSAVETWTEKYISPQIVDRTLENVRNWASQDTSEDPMAIRTNIRAREVALSREIDDQQLTAVIRLPANYPLALATCHGLNRVAVDSKKWQAWLLNMQGVITFSNNSLIDGIVAFRRNVTGALKGHTECAICYSIVGADKQLPTKKCGTCKNLFHGSCLYRWFKSSNSSSCPLCRNPFNYS